MANQGDVRKSDRYYPDDLPGGKMGGGGERQRIRDEAAGITKKYEKEKFKNTSPGTADDEEEYRRSRNLVNSRSNEDDLGSFWASKPQKKPYQYAKGGNVKNPGKKKILQAVMAAHQAGIQKGAAAAGGAGMPPGLPPGGPAGAPPMGMKKGGFVPFAKKGAGKPGDKKEKWTPPWLKKGKKFAAGGSVSGGRGDGCAMRGRTKGRFC